MTGSRIMTNGWTNTGSIGAARMALWLMAPLAVLLGASQVSAQSPPPGYVPPPGPYAAAPADAVDPLWVPPRAVMRMLRSTGYEILSQPRLRGVLYSIAVVRPDGEDGRLFMDARDGRLVRFVPGFALSSRTEEDVELAYNPPSSPPNLRPTPPPGSPPVASPRKPPLSAPKTASRTPATTGVAPNSDRLQGAPKAPPAPKPTEPTAAPPPQTQAVATRPANPKPADAKPPVVLQPTQELPAVLGLE